MSLFLSINIWKITPQFWTIIWSAIVLLFVFIFVNIYIKKRNPLHRPTGLQLIIENMFIAIENLMEDATDGRMRGAYPYFMTLFLFILITANMDLLGFTAGSTAISFTLTLGTISFIGMFVVGIGTSGFFKYIYESFFIKYTPIPNPLEILSSVSPLISLSFRLFGATLATTIILAAIPVVLDSIFDAGTGIAGWYMWFPFIQIIYEWAYKGYTLFFGVIQAFIFTFLTMSYWNVRYNEEELTKRKLRYQTKKDAKLKQTKNHQVQEVKFEELNDELKKEIILLENLVVYDNSLMAGNDHHLKK